MSGAARAAPIYSHDATLVKFYLDGVFTVADQATKTIGELLQLFERDRRNVRDHRGGSIYQRAAAQSNLVVFEHLREKMMLTIPETVTACGLSKPTVARALKDLVELGIGYRADRREAQSRLSL